MKQRRFAGLALGMAAIVGLGLTGCSAGGGDAAAGGAGDGDYTIVIVPKDATNPWFVRMEEGVKTYAAETGTTAYQKGPAETDATMQVQVIQDLIAQGVDAIGVVPVDPGALETVLKQAMDAGIVVVTHEGASQQNTMYDIEAFNNTQYGAFIMEKRAEFSARLQAYARALNLPGVCCSAQLFGQLIALGKPGRADRMPLTQQAARRVDDISAAIAVVAVVDEPGSATFRAEAKRFIGDQFVLREAVVQLHHVNLFRPDSGLLIDTCRRPFRHRIADHIAKITTEAFRPIGYQRLRLDPNLTVQPQPFRGFRRA